VPRALIAGAGIAGLSAALALGRAGFETVVFERRPALAEFGAGVQITPNASRILKRFGALGRIEALALEPRAINIRRGSDGATLARLPLSDARERWGAPYLVIHRADLQSALTEACIALAGTELRFGFAVAGVSENAHGVALGLKRDMLSLQEHGDLAIGADGLRSKLRERLGFGLADKPEFSGRVAFRATVPAESLPRLWSAPEINLALGDRAHLVHYPLRGGATVNLVATIEAGWRDRSDSDPWDGEADRDALRGAFSSWSRETRAIIDSAPDWRAWPLSARAPIASYALGRVALVGDAAHPMVPFLAQGAGQAIEDAGALERHLTRAADIPAALAAYSRERAPRAGRVQRDALAQAKIYHMSGPMALARDLTMRALGPRRLLARYDWIYSV
jgi:salicylate hydroxylase